jgi:hypothetical protein
LIVAGVASDIVYFSKSRCLIFEISAMRCSRIVRGAAEVMPFHKSISALQDTAFFDGILGDSVSEQQ